MSKPRTKQRVSRRLSVEQVESRLMLSVDGLDTSIFNLDSIQAVDYAVIPTGDYVTTVSFNNPVVPGAADSNGILSVVTGEGNFNVVRSAPGSLQNWQRPTGAVVSLDSMLDGATNYQIGSLDHLVGQSIPAVVPDPPTALPAPLPGPSLDLLGGGSTASTLDSQIAGLPVPSGSDAPALPPLASGSPADLLGSTVDSIRPDVTDHGSIGDWLLPEPASVQKPVGLDAVGGNNHVGETGLSFPTPALTNETAQETFAAPKAAVPEASEGGMIPVNRVIASLQGESTGMIRATARSAAKSQTANARQTAADDVSGELARAVAFEMIEGDAATEPVAIVSPEEPASTAIRSDVANIDAAITEEAYRPATAHESTGPGQLATYSRSGGNGLNARPATSRAVDTAGDWTEEKAALLADPIAAQARGEAFSRWDRRESLHARIGEREDRESSLDAAGVLVMLALGRFAATKANQAKYDRADSRPLKRARR